MYGYKDYLIIRGEGTFKWMVYKPEYGEGGFTFTYLFSAQTKRGAQLAIDGRMRRGCFSENRSE